MDREDECDTRCELRFRMDSVKDSLFGPVELGATGSDIEPTRLWEDGVNVRGDDWRDWPWKGLELVRRWSFDATCFTSYSSATSTDGVLVETFSLRTAIVSDDVPTSTRAGRFVRAPIKALQPAPCVMSTSATSASSSSLSLLETLSRGVSLVLYQSTILLNPARNRRCMELHSSPYSPPLPQFRGSRMLSHW